MRSCVAGRTGLIHLYQQSIVIAITMDGDYLLQMPRGLALVPELLAGAAVKPGVAGLQRFGKALTVHIGEHEHLPCRFLLDDCGDKLAFHKEFIKLQGVYLLAGIPFSIRCCFT